MKNKRRSLIIDANNLFYRSFFAQKSSDQEEISALAFHNCFYIIRKYYNMHPSDEVVMAFDSYSWRKAYTDGEDCITPKKYKGNRRASMTEAEKKKIEAFDKKINEFIEFIKNNTSMLVLHKKYLEADDLIAGYILKYKDFSHILISSDKDFIQLLGEDVDLNIIDPDSGKPRTLSEWDNDPNYFIFEKCIRGDKSDNVMSAYPRVRKTVIKEAYSDEYKKQNLMNNTFKFLVNMDDGSIVEKTFNTGEVFEENRLLMDLKNQPDYIKQLINKSLLEAEENRGKFNYMKFMLYCKNNGLNNILNEIDSFVKPLSKKIDKLILN